MSEPIPYLDLKAQIKPLRAEIDAAIARTIDNCSFCLGPDVTQFEKDFAKFCGAEHCVAFNSGTSALHVALMLLNVGPGDEVITTPFTFVATSWAISYVGAKPVYVEIDDATFNLDPKLVEKAITPHLAPHEDDALEADSGIDVPVLAKIHPNGIAIPLWRKADFRSQKGLIPLCGPARGRRREGDVADELFRFRHVATPAAPDKSTRLPPRSRRP